MIKKPPYLIAAIVVSILCFLIIPYWLIQTLCLGFLFIITFSFLYIKILERNIKVERKIKNLKLTCNEKLIINFTIKNYSRLPIFMCYFYDQSAYFYIYENKNQELIKLGPKEVKYVSYKVSAQNRGLYHIGPVTFKAYDPLGLFELNLEVSAPLDITVRPARLKFNCDIFPGIPMGDIKIKNHIFEDVTMRRSVREYQYGDELKRINWRASARFQKLFTNVYDDSYDVPVFIFLNLAQDDYFMLKGSFYLEKAIEIAANIVEKARSLNLRCGFASYAVGFPYLAPKLNQTDYILDLLSVIQSQSGKLPYDPQKKFMNQLPSGVLFYEIGPKEVENYYAKVEAQREDINTSNTGVLKN